MDFYISMKSLILILIHYIHYAIQMYVLYVNIGRCNANRNNVEKWVRLKQSNSHI